MKSFIECLEENCIKYSKETAIISQARKKVYHIHSFGISVERFMPI